MATPPVPPAWPADLRLPSLEALRAFEAAARLGTFERAAEELHVSASAVGKRLTALEDLLAVALFQRGPKALTLSAAGKEYLPPVREALALLAAMPQHRRPHQRRQRLRLAAPPTLARLVLVPALPGLAEALPDLELELVLSTPFIDQPGPEADLVVRHGPLDPTGPAPLMQDQLLPLASPALLAERGAPRRLAELCDWPLLRTPLDPWAPWFRAVGLDLPEPDEGPRLVDLGLALEAALHGQGVVLARPSLARGALWAGQLQPWLGVGHTPRVAAGSAYHLHLPADASPQAQALAAWLRATCQAAADQGLERVSGPA